MKLIMILEFRYLIEGLFLLVISLFGLIGNVIAIKVIHSPKVDFNTSFKSLLTLLTLFDTSFLLCEVSTFCLPLLHPWWEEKLSPFLLPLSLPAIQVALSGSIWTTVMLALERFLTVVHMYSM